MKSFLKGFGLGLLILAVLFLLGSFFPRRTATDAETDVLASSDAEELPAEEPVKTELPDLPEEEEAESTPQEEEPEEVPQPVRLAFAGDVMFSDQFLAAYDRSGISAIADSEMLQHMQEADLFLLNEEFPFSLRGEPMEDKQFTFRTDPKYSTILNELGSDIVTVANNHALDYGRDAFCDTLDTLNAADITYIGGGYDLAEASAPAVRTINGQTFAIFAATRVSPSGSWYASDSQAGLFQTYDPAKLNQAIAEAHTQYDHIIVFVHWGIERNEIPEDYQRVLAKGYIDAGADLIVGCHPHVLQGFEYYNGVPIIYSLGNYLFGNRDGATLLLEAVFDGTEPPAIQLVPCKRSNGVLARIQEPTSLYEHLTALSFDIEVHEDGSLHPKTAE